MVDKRLILAVAGSGKTRYVIETLNLEKKFLIVTYTIDNYNTIKKRIITKYGYLPHNITLLKFFDFLYSFCAKPFLLFEYNLKGIYWEQPPEFTTRLKKEDHKKYFTRNNLLYHNRISKFIEITDSTPLIVQKLEKFYDYLIIDEFQDLGGHDFNLIMALSKANINLLYVGDFFQHTYFTSFDGVLNKSLYNDYEKYIKKIKSNNIIVDTVSLIESYRCSPTICNLISEKLGINIKSKRTDETRIHIIDDIKEIPDIIKDNDVIKLVYNDSDKQPFNSKNWGKCKGNDDYSDTCIILTKSVTKSLEENKMHEIVSTTRNKLYVAISRTKGDCFIVKQK
ncbi:UvrD-helicase domain-containing protein [Chryseobacterium gleum]|uniref:UvrD-helicase domain-containing protein n=1 Tax=Chryseobacterium gleum TaxID=250 RepID=UPI0028A065B6|nr:UvrD-helicase domain-containing protein [Chryseobacterium gleum]